MIGEYGLEGFRPINKGNEYFLHPSFCEDILIVTVYRPRVTSTGFNFDRYNKEL